MFTLLDYWNSAPGSAILTESGRRIVERRNALKISQAALLEHLRQHAGIKSRTIISEWEHGKRRIETIGQLAALADLLQCDPEYITCQSDTLRKEYHDPARRFGLSEQSFAVLEQNTVKEGIAPAIDFVLCSGNVRQALKSLLTVYESVSETETAFPAGSRPKDSDDTQLILTDDFSGMLIPKTDFITDPYGQYIVSTKQAAFIAEQQLIAEIRKAFEK